MRTYICVTGILFALITLAHVIRVGIEGMQLAKDPWFVSFTLVTVSLSVWAWRLLRAAN